LPTKQHCSSNSVDYTGIFVYQIACISNTAASTLLLVWIGHCTWCLSNTVLPGWYFICYTLYILLVPV